MDIFSVLYFLVLLQAFPTITKKMIYDKHIDKTDEELRELNKVYGKSNLSRFLDGLSAGHIDTEEKVIELTNYIRESDGLTQLENSRLRKLRDEGFIEKFATNYNKRFSTTHMLMNKMSSSISRGVKTLAMFCEKKRSHKHHQSKPKVAEHSKLGKGAYTPSFVGLEAYKESVHVLYKELNDYKHHLSEGIEICLNISAQVDYVRNHPKVAYEKHRQSREQVLTNNRTVIKRFIDMNADMENDLIEKVDKWMQEKLTLEEISAKLYHTLDEDEYNDWVISEEVMGARRQGLTNPERALWGDNKQLVMRCRAAYAHIDELNPEGQKDHLSGRFQTLLYLWSKCLPKRGMDYWLAYFNNFYKDNGGRFTPVKIGAMKMERRKITKEVVTKKDIEKFNKKMDELVNKYMIHPSAKEDKVRIAVKF